MSIGWFITIIIANLLLTSLLYFFFIGRKRKTDMEALVEALPMLDGGTGRRNLPLDKMDRLLEELKQEKNRVAAVSEEDAEILSAVQKLKKAYLFFDGPTTVRVGQRENIKVEVSHDESIRLAISEPDVTEIRLNKRVRMYLTGSDYDIKSFNSDTQVVLPGTKTTMGSDIFKVRHHFPSSRCYHHITHREHRRDL